MALLGSFIDSRTIASLSSGASASFAHGLPAAPDFIVVNALGNATVASGAALAMPRVSTDATNVSLFQTGIDNSAVLRVIAIVAHSIVR
jgi:hypothetical protein